MIVHGGPGWDHSFFIPYLAKLSQIAQLTFFDLRGCGRSQRMPSLEGYTVETVVGDMRELLDWLQIPSCALLGFSFGGRIALRYTHRHPKTVEKLILASTTAYEDFQADLEAWDEYSARYDMPTRKQVQDIWDSETLTSAEKSRQLMETLIMLDIYDEARIPQARETMRKIRYTGEWLRAWQSGALTIPTDVDYGQRLKELATPTLILHGEKDMRLPVSVARRLRDEFPQAQLAILKNSGHLAHIESTKAWNQAVIEFLSTN